MRAKDEVHNFKQFGRRVHSRGDYPTSNISSIQLETNPQALKITAQDNRETSTLDSQHLTLDSKHFVEIDDANDEKK